MYLARLYIKNYRSIKELDLLFSKGKNVIVGRNNVGKSNIIRALNIVLGENNPTYVKSENVTDIDFYTWKEKSDDGNTIEHSSTDLFIWCELERNDGETLNYEEMYKSFGFYIYSQIVEWVDRKPIKEPIRLATEELPFNYESMFEITEDDNDGKEYVNPKLKNQATLEAKLDDKYHFAFAFRAIKDTEGKIEKEIRFLFKENKDSDWILCFRAPIRNELIQSAIIPSFRDPQNQLRLSTWTWYGRLIKHLTTGYEEREDLKNAFTQVKQVADQIFTSVSSDVQQSTLDVAFPGTTVHFQFNAEKRDDLYRSCLIYVDDGFKSQLQDKGSGIQSAIVIGLFNYYTRYVNTTTSALLCIEEPEIYLHPHACRVISDRLDDFLDRGRNQVIITTHSAEFIRSVFEDLNLILIQKAEQETIATPINLRDFKNLLIDSRQAELFFADKIIITEGFDEYILSAVADEVFPGKLHEQNVSIVSVGGKDNISKLGKLALSLGIKTFILTDFDYILRDKGGEGKKYNAKLHESVLSLGLEFFCQSCILGNKGEDMFASLQKIRSEIKAANEKIFYTAKKCEECQNESLFQILNKLHQNGVCILSCEIEDLSKDPIFLSPVGQKLNLDKIFELKSKLSSGQKISSIINIDELSKFLEIVFTR